jgi:hypothetical protein
MNHLRRREEGLGSIDRTGRLDLSRMLRIMYQSSVG